MILQNFKQIQNRAFITDSNSKKMKK